MYRCTDPQSWDQRYILYSLQIHSLGIKGISVYRLYMILIKPALPFSTARKAPHYIRLRELLKFPNSNMFQLYMQKGRKIQLQESPPLKVSMYHLWSRQDQTHNLGINSTVPRSRMQTSAAPKVNQHSFDSYQLGARWGGAIGHLCWPRNMSVWPLLSVEVNARLQNHSRPTNIQTYKQLFSNFIKVCHKGLLWNHADKST